MEVSWNDCAVDLGIYTVSNGHRWDPKELRTSRRALSPERRGLVGESLDSPGQRPSGLIDVLPSRYGLLGCGLGGSLSTLRTSESISG